MARGFFITFEGPEGSGKTTQAKLLYENFLARKIPVILTREPGGLPEGEAIRAILKGTQYHLTNLAQMYLFSASRNMFVERVVRPNLEKGVHVISDRFADSTRAYQGYAGGGDLMQIERMIQESTKGISPDLTLIMDINPQDGLAKEVEDSSFSRLGLDYHERVREGYIQIARLNPKRCSLIPYLDGKPQEMHGQVLVTINHRLKI